MCNMTAYLLAVLGVNESPTEKDTKNILSSVGMDADSASLKLVISEQSGKNIEESLPKAEKNSLLSPQVVL